MKQIAVILKDGKIIDIEGIPEGVEIKVREHNNLLNSTVWSKKKTDEIVLKANKKKKRR